MGSSRESIRSNLREIVAIVFSAASSFMFWWLLAQQFTIGSQHGPARHYQYGVGIAVGLLCSFLLNSGEILQKRSLLYATAVPLVTADLAWSVVLGRPIMLVFASLFSAAGAVAYYSFFVTKRERLETQPEVHGEPS